MTAPDAWYWGELRSALAVQPARIERAWSLLAAWPISPEAAPLAEAMRYALCAAPDLEAMMSAGWMLDHYRRTPVVIRPPTKEEEQLCQDFAYEDPPHSAENWEDSSNRGAAVVTRSRFLDGGGSLCVGRGSFYPFDIRLDRDGAGELKAFWGFCEGRVVTSPHELGERMLLLGRELTLIEAAEEPGPSLTWDPDLRGRIALEGPGLHPNLKLITIDWAWDYRSATESGAMLRATLKGTPPRALGEVKGRYPPQFWERCSDLLSPSFLHQLAPRSALFYASLSEEDLEGRIRELPLQVADTHRQRWRFVRREPLFSLLTGALGVMLGSQET